MPMIVRAFPVLRGKEDEAMKFAEAVSGPRKSDFAAFLQSFGVRRESWHLQQTPAGMQVIVVTDVEDPPMERAQAYSQSQEAFARWFKDNVKALSGIDPDTQPLGPPTQTIVSSDSVLSRRKTFDSPTA